MFSEGLEQINNSEAFNQMNWRRPDLKDLHDEVGEIERTVSSFLNVAAADTPEFREALKGVVDSLLAGRYEQLTEEQWAKLENTDSYENVPLGGLDQAEALAKEYGRDYASLMEAIHAGKELPAPTILEYHGKMHKVAGNTRLMIARALGQAPMVLIGTYAPERQGSDKN